MAIEASRRAVWLLRVLRVILRVSGLACSNDWESFNVRPLMDRLKRFVDRMPRIVVCLKNMQFLKKYTRKQNPEKI